MAIRLYHSTRFKNLANIIRRGEMTVDNYHKEGHGDMLWFTTSDDYGSEVKISIDVPEDEFENGRFEFVNRIHVVTYENVNIKDYNFSIDSFSPIFIDDIGAYVGFNKDRLTRFINKQPNGALEKIAFDGFVKQYGQNEDMQIILDFLKKKNKVYYVNEAELKEIIRESIRKIAGI